MSVYAWASPKTPGPYLRFAQRASSSHARWWSTLTNELDDTAYSKRRYNVVGPIMDLSVLTAAERGELQRLACMLRRDQTAEELAREQELMAKLPRLTVSGGYDIDTSDDASVAPNGDAIRAACDELHRRLADEETKRGMLLRAAWSGDPRRGKRHLEWGHAVPPGHVSLLRAMLGRARDVCKAAGLVPRQIVTASGRSKLEDRMWCLPDDPTGALAFLDLSNLERAPGSRSSTFRALGGWHKDMEHRKVLMEGSPPAGGAITPAMVEEGLRLYEEQEREAGRRARNRTAPLNHGPTYSLPMSEEVRPLPLGAAVMSSWWQPGVGHNLRLSAAGALVRSGLFNSATLVHLLGAATGNVDDARTTVISTAQRMRQGAPVKGVKSFRDDVGSFAVFNLAWALAHDMREFAFSYIWSRLAVTRSGEAHESKELCKRLEELAATTEDTDEKAKVHKIRRRLQAAPYCRLRRADGRCPCCDKLRCSKFLECGDPSCPPCTLQKVQDVVELIKLPRHTTVIYRGEYKTKDEAREAVKSATYRMMGDKPLVIYNPSPDGWEVTMLLASSNDLGIACVGRIDGHTYDRLLPHQARNWIARALIMRHVMARHAIESPKAPVHLLVEAYRKHTVSSMKSPIKWPTKEQIKQLRIERAMRARAANAENPDAAAPDECDCPDETCKANPAVIAVCDADTGAVIVDDLASTPTLAQVIAHERGEKVRLHKRRRFFWRPRRARAFAARE